jgi:hypothetical protein
MDGGKYEYEHRIRYSGDTRVAVTHKGAALLLLQQLITSSTSRFLDLQINEASKVLSDGSVITAYYLFGQPTVEIYSPLEEDKPINDYFQCWLYRDDPDNSENPQIRTPINFAVKDLVSWAEIPERQGNVECYGTGYLATFDGGQCFFSNSNIRSQALNDMFHPNLDYTIAVRNPSSIRNGEIYGEWTGHRVDYTGDQQTDFSDGSTFLRTLQNQYKIWDDTSPDDLYKTYFFLNGKKYDTYDATSEQFTRVTGVTRIEVNGVIYVAFIVQPIRTVVNIGVTYGYEEIWAFVEGEDISTALLLETMTYTTSIYAHTKSVLNHWVFSPNGKQGIAFRPRMEQFGEFYQYNGYEEIIFSVDQNGDISADVQWVGTIPEDLYAKDPTTWTQSDENRFDAQSDSWWRTYTEWDSFPQYYQPLGMSAKFVDNVFQYFENMGGYNIVSEGSDSGITWNKSISSILGMTGNVIEHSTAYRTSDTSVTGTTRALITEGASFHIIDVIPKHDFILYIKTRFAPFMESRSFVETEVDADDGYVNYTPETLEVSLMVQFKGIKRQLGSTLKFNNVGGAFLTPNIYAGVPYGSGTGWVYSPDPDGWQDYSSALFSGAQAPYVDISGGNVQEPIDVVFNIRQARIGGSYKLSKDGTHAVVSMPYGDLARYVFLWANRNVADQYSAAGISSDMQNAWNKYMINYAILYNEEKGLEVRQLSTLLFGDNVESEITDEWAQGDDRYEFGIKEKDTTAFLPIGLYAEEQTDG